MPAAMKTLRPLTLRARRSHRGVALIEALVGILLFCIGILGLVGLQVSMTRAQTVAKFRADAVYLTNDIVSAIWIDKANLSSYATTPTSACTLAPCADWVTKVASTLPQGAATVAVTPGTGDVAIRLTWSPPNEGTRSYVLTTQVK
jgi:type IV pilus assembly protein PilV